MVHENRLQRGAAGDTCGSLGIRPVQATGKLGFWAYMSKQLPKETPQHLGIDQEERLGTVRSVALGDSPRHDVCQVTRQRSSLCLSRRFWQPRSRMLWSRHGPRALERTPTKELDGHHMMMAGSVTRYLAAPVLIRHVPVAR